MMCRIVVNLDSLQIDTVALMAAIVQHELAQNVTLRGLVNRQLQGDWVEMTGAYWQELNEIRHEFPGVQFAIEVPTIPKQ